MFSKTLYNMNITSKKEKKMVLSLTGLGYASAVAFSTWHFTSLIIKIKQKVSTHFTIFFDSVFILGMSFLLVNASKLFLFILLVVTFLKTLTGGLIFLTDVPEGYNSQKNEIIENFWTKTAVDALLGLICYCIMLYGGVTYE